MRVWKYLLALFLLTAPVHAASRLASVSVNTSGSGLTIPSNFVGLSTENGDFVNGYYQGTSGQWTSNGTTGNAASYCSLINLLGSAGVFRIGGSTSNNATAPNITSGMASNLASFLGCLGANWTLVYGLDGNANNSAAAVTTVTNLATAIGVSKIVFQTVNEPSLSGLSLATYESRWNAYYTAITGSVASTKWGAIDDILNTGYTVPLTAIAALTPGLSGMQFVSQHWYSFCNGTWPSPSPAMLLSSVSLNQYIGSQLGSTNGGGGYFFNNGLTGTVPQIMTESNSICGSGQAGMSDRMMGTAWYLSLAINLANAGWNGMYIHGNWNATTPAVYNPAVVQPDNNFGPGTIFYGMFLFSKIEGLQILPSAVGGNANVKAIATKGANGNANILAVNNDITNYVTLTPQQSGAWTTANVLIVKDADGEGCVSASLTVGGQPIGESGSWTGAPSSINNGQSVQIPPCGSALIQIQP